MAIIFDEVIADIAPPTQTTSASEQRNEGNRGPSIDPQSLLREIQRAAERAERLNAD